MRRNTKLNLIIKTIIFFFVLWVTYKHLSGKGDLGNMYTLLKERLEKPEWWMFIMVFLAMPVNWIIESQKWQCVIRTYMPIGFRKAMTAILQGITLGIVTPHRIGEYGGRILVLEPENNWKGIAATFVCSLAQNVVNVALGLLALTLYINGNSDLLASDWWIAASIFLLVLLLVAYLFLHRLSFWLGRMITWSRVQSYLEKLHLLDRIPTKTLFFVLLMAVGRYLIYFMQYYLLLQFFGYEISLLNGFAGIGMIYLIQTGIPLPSILSIAARGEIALLVWGTTYGMGILAATFTLWIINLLIPAIIGLFFVLNTNVVRSLGYEK